MRYHASREHVTDGSHWRHGPESARLSSPHVAHLLGVAIYSESGYTQAHATTGYDDELNDVLIVADQPVPQELADRGWVHIKADGSVE